MTDTAVTHGARAQADETLKSLPLPDSGEAIFLMGDVESLDTAGAWLIHRTERALQERGVTVHLNDTAPRFAGLIEAIRRNDDVHPEHEPARNAFVAMSNGSAARLTWWRERPGTSSTSSATQ